MQHKNKYRLDMKKGILIAVFSVLAFCSAGAQNQNLGLRLGYGAEASYQQYLGKNRLEFDLGLDLDKRIGLVGMYQWVNPLGGNFKWYLGLGAGVGILDKDFALSAVGDLGIEYKFPKAPIQLSLDYRPGLNIVPKVGFWGSSVGLGIRYCF